VLDGRVAIRAAIVNHRTEARDIDAALAAAIKFGRERTDRLAASSLVREDSV
jgi:aromatic-L-amino-acid/L-tryptophan decarboxylase